MLPSWIIALSIIEMVGFLAFALGIATAVPEEALVRVRSEPSSNKSR